MDECGVCDGLGPITCLDGSSTCDDCPDAPQVYSDWLVSEDCTLETLTQYQYNGSITALVSIDGSQLGSDGDLLASFVGNEVRGVACPFAADFGPYAGSNLFLIMNYGNETSGDMLTFKYYDFSEDLVLDISETIEFESDMTLGNIISPIGLNVATDVEISFDVSNGWNWISVNVSNDDMSVNNVFGTVGGPGDYVKSQGGFADYYDGFGWYGTLGTLNPFEGYMVQLASGGTLVYPEGSGMARTVSYDNQINLLDFNYRDYEFNGSITSEINIDNITISDSDLLIAYVDGECRGYGSPLLFPLTDKYIFPIMVYGNNDRESNISFEYYNANTNKYYNLSENIDFESDMTIGDGLNPYLFDGENNEIVSGLSVKSAYPNPFNPSTNIEYSISQSGNVKVAIYDVTGRQVDVIYNEYQPIGEYSLVWNALSSPSGIYYIQIQSDNDVHTQKVVLLK